MVLHTIMMDALPVMMLKTQAGLVEDLDHQVLVLTLTVAQAVELLTAPPLMTELAQEILGTVALVVIAPAITLVHLALEILGTTQGSIMVQALLVEIPLVDFHLVQVIPTQEESTMTQTHLVETAPAHLVQGIPTQEESTITLAHLVETPPAHLVQVIPIQEEYTMTQTHLV